MSEELQSRLHAAASGKLRVVILGSIPFLVIGLAWFLLVSGGFVNETFLPSMSGVLKSLGLVFSRESYVQDVWVSVYRVMAAFVASAVLAVPIGLLAGHTERGARL